MRKKTDLKISFDLLARITANRKITKSGVKVLCEVVRTMDSDNRIAYTQYELAKRTGITIAIVALQLGHLAKAGYLTRLAEKGATRPYKVTLDHPLSYYDAIQESAEAAQ